jgi:hypothetical protein
MLQDLETRDFLCGGGFQIKERRDSVLVGIGGVQFFTLAKRWASLKPRWDILDQERLVRHDHIHNHLFFGGYL